MLDPLLLARIQFAATTVFHFFFVPITIGMVFLIAIFESIYVKTGDEHYKRITKFFGHLFLINFAVGVVTGILQEFQFGMNWSEYSSFVGDVFGPSLAIEALLAFYLESTFIGIWIFSWEKINKKLHAMCIWLVGIGTVIQVISILHSRRLSDFLLRQRQYFRQFLRGIIPRKMNTCHVFQVPIQARSQ